MILYLGFSRTGSIQSHDLTFTQHSKPVHPVAKKTEDVDIEAAFTKYGHSDMEKDDPPSSPDSDGGKAVYNTLLEPMIVFMPLDQ